MKDNLRSVSLLSNRSSEILFAQPTSQQWESKPHSRLTHTCQLDIDQVAQFPRITGIVCTLGESWNSPKGIQKMIDGGMSILRLNVSNTPRETCKEVIKCVRDLDKASNYRQAIAIAMDMTAAPLRTGIFGGDCKKEVLFIEGSKVELTTDEEFKNKGTDAKIYVDTQFFPQMIHVVHKGDRIYLADGIVILIVKEIGMNNVICMVEEGGAISGNQRVILPRERLNQNSLEANYLKELAFASECEVDFVFTSHADDANMLAMARARLPADTKVFAKIETRESVRNLSELIEHADGIIVSRAYLGLHYHAEKIFKLQKYIIGHCNLVQKPVFVIGQLIESMIEKPRPTRAEASDVANAVFDGADGLILTVETSRGIYPYEAVEFTHMICREAERAVFHETARLELKGARAARGICKTDVTHVTALSAVEAAASCNATAIFVITTSGSSAYSVAGARPSCPVVGITRHVTIARHAHAYRGLHPFVYTGQRLADWSEDMDLRLNAAIDRSCEDGYVKAGDNVIIVTGSLAGTGSTNVMQVFRVPALHKKLKVVSSSINLTYTRFDLQEMRLETVGDDNHLGITEPRIPL